MQQIRIKEQMTIAQVEIELAKAVKQDNLPALVRFNPNRTELLTKNGIKFRKIDDNNYDDLFRVFV